MAEIGLLRCSRPVERDAAPMSAAADGRPLVAACYIVRKSRLLMVRHRNRRAGPEWSGPSGNVEPARRRRRPPSARSVRRSGSRRGGAPLGDRVYPASGRHLVYLMCRVLTGKPAVIDHEDIAEVEWCDLPRSWTAGPASRAASTHR
jgi:8-oxo-dGTP diphosphatase